MIKSNMQVAGGISTLPAGNISQNVKLDYPSPSIGEKCVRKVLVEEEEGGGGCLVCSILKLLFQLTKVEAAAKIQRC